jgi:hypothetical protein
VRRIGARLAASDGSATWVGRQGRGSLGPRSQVGRVVVSTRFIFAKEKHKLGRRQRRARASAKVEAGVGRPRPHGP